MSRSREKEDAARLKANIQGLLVGTQHTLNGIEKTVKALNNQLQKANEFNQKILKNKAKQVMIVPAPIQSVGRLKKGVEEVANNIDALINITQKFNQSLKDKNIEVHQKNQHNQSDRLSPKKR